MTLPPLRLDDLTWADLVARVTSRIPAESAGRWTLHAPVDPGITVLELYAWQLEQRLYLLDRVPDALVDGVLTLLGVAGRRPARPGRTVLSVAAAGPPTPVRLPSGSEMVAAIGAETVVLSTDDDVALVPVRGLRLRVDGVDRTAELGRAGVAVPLFGDPDRPGEVGIGFELAAGAAVPRGAPLGLYVELDGSLPPSWSHDAVPDVAPPAVLTWHVVAGDGTVHAVPEDAVDDGTGGLRRSGIVRIAWPSVWRRTAGPVERTLLVRAERSTFAFPPRLRALAANAVPARNRRVHTAQAGELDAQAEGWFARPDATLRLTDRPATLLEDEVELRMRERDGREHRWHATRALDTQGPGDRVFVVDRARGVLRFGDGYRGRIPVPAGPAPRLAVRFATSGGPSPSVGPGVAWTGPAGVSATTVVALDGGRETETVAAARERAVAELRTPRRAVSPDDYRELALTTPGVSVARSDVAVGLHPSTPCTAVPGAVTVTVVPDVPPDPLDPPGRAAAEPQPDPGMLASVRRRLSAARLVGTEVFVRGPRYRPVRVVVEIETPVADTAAVLALLREALATHLHPLHGGDDGTGRPFGEPVQPSELSGVARRAVGTRAAVRAVGVALADTGDGEPEFCADVPIRAHELVGNVEVRIVGRARRDAGEGLT